MSRSTGRDACLFALFGPLAVGFYLLAWRPPQRVALFLSEHFTVNVAATVAGAALAAYLCRRVVHAVLRLLGL